MARPMFAFDPNDMIRRLGLAGGQPPANGWEDENLPLAWQSAAAGNKNLAAGLSPAAASPFGDGGGAFGQMLKDAGASVANQPLVAATAPAAQPSPFTPMAAPQMPAFAPSQMPAQPAFAPVRVDNAIRTGMVNPAGDSQWDRSLTATSPEEELRFRQQAKYNDVLDLIRPGGIGMPGTTGPIVGLQPWEVQALSNLGGRQAGDVTGARQITSAERTADNDRALKALLGNQQTQTQRDVANLEAQSRAAAANMDAQTRRDVAGIEAGSRNNPNTIKAQFAAQYLAGGGSPQQLGGMLHSLQQNLSPMGGAGAMSPPPSAGVPSPQDEIGAMGAVNSIAAMIGKGQPGGQFQLGEFGPEQAGKVLDFVAGLKSPGEQQAVLRELMSGRLGNQMTIRDNLLKVGAGANYQIQPPLNPKTGKPVDEFSEMGAAPPPYAIQDDAGRELFRYSHDPSANLVRNVISRSLGSSPYTRLELPNGMGVVPLDSSLMNPSVFAGKLPRQTLENRARVSQQMLRQLIADQKR